MVNFSTTGGEKDKTYIVVITHLNLLEFFTGWVGDSWGRGLLVWGRGGGKVLNQS